MPAGLLLVHTKAREGCRDILCVHKRGRGSTQQTSASVPSSFGLLGGMSINRAWGQHFWTTAKAASYLAIGKGFISHMVLGMCSWRLLHPEISVVTFPWVQALLHLRSQPHTDVFAHRFVKRLCTSVTIQINNYLSKLMFLTKCAWEQKQTHCTQSKKSKRRWSCTR